MIQRIQRLRLYVLRLGSQFKFKHNEKLCLGQPILAKNRNQLESLTLVPIWFYYISSQCQCQCFHMQLLCPEACSTGGPILFQLPPDGHIRDWLFTFTFSLLCQVYFVKITFPIWTNHLNSKGLPKITENYSYTERNLKMRIGINREEAEHFHF